MITQIVLQKRNRNRKTPPLYKGNAGVLQKNLAAFFLRNRAFMLTFVEEAKMPNTKNYEETIVYIQKRKESQVHLLRHQHVQAADSKNLFPNKAAPQAIFPRKAERQRLHQTKSRLLQQTLRKKHAAGVCPPVVRT